MKKSIIVITIGVAAVFLLVYMMLRPSLFDALPFLQPPDGKGSLVSFNDENYGLSFVYPLEFGNISTHSGSGACPEEDTYRTPDTLSVFDTEYAFPEIRWSGSQSFIRIGIRTYRQTYDSSHACQDFFLRQAASPGFSPETISSMRLVPVYEGSSLKGFYNQEASRLWTEGRVQYTFIRLEGETTLFVQPYFSFVPHAGSPELDELENVFDGDMQEYLRDGKTSSQIRAILQSFQDMAESVAM